MWGIWNLCKSAKSRSSSWNRVTVRGVREAPDTPTTTLKLSAASDGIKLDSSVIKYWWEGDKEQVNLHYTSLKHMRETPDWPTLSTLCRGRESKIIVLTCDWTDFHLVCCLQPTGLKNQFASALIDVEWLQAVAHLQCSSKKCNPESSGSAGAEQGNWLLDLAQAAW